VRKGRPWSLPLEDRALLVTAYWRTNLTLRQPAPLFGISKSAADRIIAHLGPALALQPRRRFRKDTVLIVDGTLVPTRDRAVAAPSKNYRYSTNHQVVIDADTRLVVDVGKPLPGNRNDCRAVVVSAGLPRKVLSSGQLVGFKNAVQQRLKKAHKQGVDAVFLDVRGTDLSRDIVSSAVRGQVGSFSNGPNFREVWAIGGNEGSSLMSVSQWYAKMYG
jgi:hypothetical protein